jgi:dolichol-phosphate mannosyltransferase
VRALVIIPTYNEAATIGPLVQRVLEHADPSVDVLVVDDGSADGTAEVVQEVNTERVNLLQRGKKRGLGSAYVDGFGWALDRGYDAIVEMDGDLSHDPAAVPVLLGELQHADLVIGSRYVPGGAIENWGALRRLLSYAGNLYARAWLAFGVRDSTSGFRAYRSTVLASQDLDSVHSEGYAFQIEMTNRVAADGGRIEELPITFSERRHGRSKLSRTIVFEALLSVPVWGVRKRLRALARSR